MNMFFSVMGRIYLLVFAHLIVYITSYNVPSMNTLEMVEFPTNKISLAQNQEYKSPKKP